MWSHGLMLGKQLTWVTSLTRKVTSWSFSLDQNRAVVAAAFQFIPRRTPFVTANAGQKACPICFHYACRLSSDVRPRSTHTEQSNG